MSQVSPHDAGSLLLTQNQAAERVHSRLEAADVPTGTTTDGHVGSLGDRQVAEGNDKTEHVTRSEWN